ncbi:MAG: DUF7453 family protein, partial [Planctomycetota bacterium]
MESARPFRRHTAGRPCSRLAVAWLLAGASGVAGAGGDVNCDPCTPLTLRLEGDAAPGTGAAYQSFDRPNITADGSVAFTANTDGATGSDDVVYVGEALVAREGDPAPGVPGATLGPFEFFQTGHQANVHGELVYIANLVDAPAGADRALYRDAALVVQEGAVAPGTGGRIYHGFGFAGLTDDGRVGLLADLDGPAIDDSVISLGGEVLYREGDAVPGRPELLWDGNFDELQWNGRGDCLFEGNTSLPSAVDMVL